MCEKILTKGNYAIAKAAIKAGCECYFGYPITPQSEIGEYFSKEMPKLNRTFVAAESEIAAINMVLGASSTGVKAMTSSSSCAIALMQEAISYIASDELPCVLVSVMRGGPGLGYIFPSQGDYTQTIKGGGNGDYRVITLSPSSVQEAVDLTYKSFYLSQKYRNIVCLLLDGLIGQMMEPVEFYEYPYEDFDNSSWALSGAKNRDARKIASILKTETELENHVKKLFAKYEVIEQNEVMFENYMTEDADLIITAFGSVARIAKSAINSARKQGLKVGLHRPITLFPFSNKELKRLSKNAKMFLDIELNMGQMYEDVCLAIKGEKPVLKHCRPAGYMFTDEEILEIIKSTIEEGMIYGNACI